MCDGVCILRFRESQKNLETVKGFVLFLNCLIWWLSKGYQKGVQKYIISPLNESLNKTKSSIYFISQAKDHISYCIKSKNDQIPYIIYEKCQKNSYVIKINTST